MSHTNRTECGSSVESCGLRARGLLWGTLGFWAFFALACADGPLFTIGEGGGFGPGASSDVVGRLQSHQISGEETLLDLTRSNQLGYSELLAANPGVDPWVPGVGTRIVLPTAHVVPPGPREGIVVNLAEQRLYLFSSAEADEGRGRERVVSYPIGVSREGWATPLGKTAVKRKRAAPAWFPTASARKEDPTLGRKVEPGPENPLGTHALYLGWPQYLIHGTNEPDGVGRRVSRGCIRLYPEHIIELFEAVPVDTKVRVIHEPIKLARVGKHLFLEVHPTLEDLAELEAKSQLAKLSSNRVPDALRARIRAQAGTETDRVDWERVGEVVAGRRGIPVRVTR